MQEWKRLIGRSKIKTIHWINSRKEFLKKNVAQTIERKKTLGRHTVIKLRIKCFHLKITNFRIMLRMSNGEKKRNKKRLQKYNKNNSECCLNLWWRTYTERIERMKDGRSGTVVKIKCKQYSDRHTKLMERTQDEYRFFMSPNRVWHEFISDIGNTSPDIGDSFFFLLVLILLLLLLRWFFQINNNILNPFSTKRTKGHTLPNNRNEVEKTTKTTIGRDGLRWWWWWRWNNNQKAKAKCYVEHTNTFKPVIIMWLRVFVWFSFIRSLFVSVAIEYRLDHSVFFQLRSPWSWKWYTREGKKKLRAKKKKLKHIMV